MLHTYHITGMTCEGCKKSVEAALLKVDHLTEVSVDLEHGTATITMDQSISLDTLQKALPSKYQILEQASRNIFENAQEASPKSKWRQLRPLFLIFSYLFASAFLLHYRAWDWGAALLDFTGLFFIVFSFFKFLDLKGFPESFRMYDPLAKILPLYGWVYPFIELGLGLLFLMRVEVNLALWITLVVLGITTFGVTKSLLDKKAIRCACLGTALNLPMTEATFIENAIMIVMTLWMLLKGGLL